MVASRGSPSMGPFAIPVGRPQLDELLAFAGAEWDRQQGEGFEEWRGRRLRLTDARSQLTDCRVAETRALQHAGKARTIVETRLALDGVSWAQDWPLEVCDPNRLDEFCAFYDETEDPLVRFDVMQLALFSYDEQPDQRVRADWFGKTLRRDFAIHGHTVAYWAALDRDADDPELRRPNPEFVFAISSLLRDVWDQSLVPVDVTLA